MADWLNQELDRILEDDFLEWQGRANTEPNAVEFGEWLANYGPQIADALRGYPEPLRKALKEHPVRWIQALAPLIGRPKRGRGQRFPKIKRADLVDAAVDDVKRIRKLWKKNYGKQNRRADDGASAEEIAADRWEVDKDDINKRLKKFPAK